MGMIEKELYSISPTDVVGLMADCHHTARSIVFFVLQLTQSNTVVGITAYSCE
ncbi:hypothetical protein AD16_4991 [Escherichia coli 3-267-03_S4_C2]|nr:hypothetical protein EC1011_3538 [Escherichia coli 101-1]EZK22358.1 hypothetical protein AB26_2251 [Escherichia coli 2-011-08_S1_C2]KDU22142.1 hypothetical protein AD16_4991 [Escherichia coli 3-267-03_S4_C2]KDX40555.1 hypothetical protein AC16_4944 [Escherichia coli 2-177-06_S3_C2]KDX87390.1 hypothetical protein AC99_3818 [Escherichia coli 2-222-05_S4_C2]KEO08315.1 hypothetical protein AD29_4942 [Escherichia coli 2-222-05_S4_C3]